MERFELLKKTCSQPATTLQSTDLKLKDSVQVGDDAEEKYKISPSEGVKCSVSIPKYYYTPGEQITVDVSIINHSSVSLENVRVEFVRVEDYDVARRGKDCKAVITETILLVRIQS